MTDRELLQHALEALEEIHPGNMTPMAEEAWNKAITVLRERLAQKDEPSAEPTRDDVIAFLLGEGPLDGVWFDEPHPTYKGRFWWRAYLRKATGPSAEPVDLQDIEQYRMQMAGICTAALGYWREGDSVHPDYDTPALREVATLYAKYAKLAAQPKRTPRQWVGLTDSELDRIWCAHHDDNCQTTGGCWDYERAIAQALKEKNAS